MDREQAGACHISFVIVISNLISPQIPSDFAIT